MTKLKNVPEDPLSKDAYRIFENTNDPIINEILNILSQGNFLPKFTQNYGNSYAPAKNEMSVSPNSLTINTVAHELSHALYELMTRHRSTAKQQNTSNLFTEAFDKLQNPPKKLMPKEPLTPWEQYRYSNLEAPAWGVGNAANPIQEFTRPIGKRPPPLHLDSTLATEQAILRELFSRTLKTK